jgi:hypothetical protein
VNQLSLLGHEVRDDDRLGITDSLANNDRKNSTLAIEKEENIPKAIN